MKDYLSKIKQNIALSEDFSILQIENSEVAKKASPGQFVMIRLNDSFTPLLRRPFSIHDSDGKSYFSIMIKVVGKGTRYLQGLSAGDKIKILGPLGKGFDFSDTKSCSIHIGGGIGIAPMLLAVKNSIKLKKDTLLFYGARSANEIFLEDKLSGLDCSTFYCTDDGSFGTKDFVSVEVEKYIRSNGSDNLEMFACGPHPLLKALSKIAEQYSIPLQVSCEERMACGMGACLGCSCTTAGGNKKTCIDGPVFDSREIIWE